MVTIPLSLIVVHSVADFVLQTNWQAINKSKSNEALTKHVLVYSLCFVPWGFKFYLLTFLTHWITDYFTSRCTSKLFFFKQVALDGCDPPFRTEWMYIPSKRGPFFWMIGLDQLIHFITLAITYKLVFGG